MRDDASQGTVLLLGWTFLGFCRSLRPSKKGYRRVGYCLLYPKEWVSMRGLPACSIGCPSFFDFFDFYFLFLFPRELSQEEAETETRWDFVGQRGKFGHYLEEGLVGYLLPTLTSYTTCVLPEVSKAGHL